MPRGSGKHRPWARQAPGAPRPRQAQPPRRPHNRRPRAHLQPAESWPRCISGASSPPGPGSPARSLPGAAPAGSRGAAAPAKPWRPPPEPGPPAASRLRSRLGACRDVTRTRRARPDAPVTSYACEGPAVTARHRRLAAGPREDSTRPGRSGEVRGLQFHPTADGGRCGAEQDAEDGEDPAPPGLFPSGGVIRKGREGERKGFAGAAAATQAPCRRRRRPSRAAPAPHAASGLQPGCQGRRKPARCPRGHSPPGRTERDTTVLSAE